MIALYWFAWVLFRAMFWCFAAMIWLCVALVGLLIVAMAAIVSIPGGEARKVWRNGLRAIAPPAYLRIKSHA